MSLSQLLTEQQRRLDALIALLEQERSLLAEADIDGQALADIAAQKRERLQQLEKTESLRRSVQRRLGYPEGLEGAGRAARDADCQPQWEQTLERTRQAQHLNTLNGQLVDLRMSQNKRLLDFIHESADRTVYRASGRVAAQPGRLNTTV